MSILRKSYLDQQMKSNEGEAQQNPEHIDITKFEKLPSSFRGYFRFLLESGQSKLRIG
jgi:hypothetical protein